MKTDLFYPTDPSDKVSLPVTNGTPSGTPVVVGSLVGITATAEGKDGNVEGNASVWLGGAPRVPVTTATAVAVGAPVYITSAYVLTPSASGNTLWGYALEAKGTAPATIRVKIAKV